MGNFLLQVNVDIFLLFGFVGIIPPALFSLKEKTLPQDVNALWDILAEARNPGGLLSVKLKELEDGTFTGRSSLSTFSFWVT